MKHTVIVMHPRILFVLRLAVAIIIIQTLRFKFTGHPDSVYIFETVGMEPYGRWGIGVMELISGVLLLFKPTAKWGALLATGIMAGAVGMHLSLLGITVRDDGGLLFGTAVLTLVLSLVILYFEKRSANRAI